MEDKKIEMLIKEIEELKKQVNVLSKKWNEQERKEALYQTDEYQTKLRKFLRESMHRHWGLYVHFSHSLMKKVEL